MLFEKDDTLTLIDDAKLKEMWDASDTEHYVLYTLVKIRQAQGLSQVGLAKKAGSKQQIISRIENRENSPTLKTLCRLIDVLGYKIQIVPKE